MVLALAASSHADVLRAGDGAEPVDFLVTPVVGAGELERLEIVVRLTGDPDGRTTLALPNRWAGSDALIESIEALTVDGGTTAEGEDPASRVVTHAPGAPLVVRYRLRAAGTADPGPDYEKARPVLRPSCFYVHGEGVFVTPEGREEEPARFRWGSKPSDWRLASDAEMVADGLTVGDVSEAILIGGTDLRILERRIGGHPIRLALRGQWSFSDDGLADAAARIVAAGNAYFGAQAVPYLITLIPLTGAETGATSYGGTGRAAGFALASTTNVGLDRFLFTLAHEYGHRWFGGSLGPIPDPDAPEYWFTEGFGDFAAAQSLVRAGLWDEAVYAAHLNATLLRYASSSARTLANVELAERFWTDPAAMQMPYDRGHLFALTLDRNGAVGAALRRMAASAASFPAGETQAARFVRAHAPIFREVDAMLRGVPIALPRDLFAACGTIEWAEQPVYVPGYTAEERADGRYFATVEEASPAWTAGLRPGMRYIRRESFRPNDATVPIVMRVADAAGERVLRWLPQGRQTVRFQMLSLFPFSGEEARRACLARLAGAALS
ncbi:hypothetical protein [Sphingosinicella sp. CPCC 101087]|uniref:M61 family metallopeptidase n=1 Tax=Sphingosinicella sp. CPCC 101087 TaxID=2497754 RepID=UPI0019802050|nr:hypothetical protein [Sphingosinicella sp. CPCC 101087]